MIRLLLFSVLLLPLYAVSQRKNVTIRIEQDGITYPLTGQDILLRKQPFRIVVTLQGVNGVYSYAGFTDSIYKLRPDQKIPDFENMPSMTMAEATFNEDRELIISNDAWAYWFYEKGTDWHRFDKDIKVEKDSVVGVKTVKQFYFPPTESTLQVTEVKKPLYLFFVAIDIEDKDGTPKKELMRSKVRINWQ